MAGESFRPAFASDTGSEGTTPSLKKCRIRRPQSQKDAGSSLSSFCVLLPHFYMSSPLAQTINAGAALICYFLLIMLALLRSVQVNARAARGPSAEMFQQIQVDLEPYAISGISQSMIEGVYCGIRDGGFRVQIKDNRIYIAGEVVGIQSRNRNVKLQLLRLAIRYPILPEVDFVVGTGDCPAIALRNISGMAIGGPVFVQVSSTYFLQSISII